MRRHPVWTVFGGISALLLLLAAIAIWVNFGQGWPAIRVSRETTYITEPLKPNGRPDYVAAINEMMREGVTPETNAMVLLQEALGPQPEESNIEFGHAMSDALGVPRLPAKGDYLVPLSAFRESLYSGLSPDERRSRFSQDADAFKVSYNEPWTSEKIPHLVRWFELNEKPFALIHEASIRPHFYSPIVHWDPGGASEKRLVSTLLPYVQMNLGLGRTLVSRAMWHLGEGRLPEAKADLLAVHRLARHASRGWTLIELFFAEGMEYNATGGDVHFGTHPDLTAELAAEYRRELQALPPLITIDRLAELVDYDRMMILDVVVAFQTDPSFELGLGLVSQLPPYLLNSTPRLTVDLNEALVVINDAYDQLVEIVGERDETRRQQLQKELDVRMTLRKRQMEQLRKNPIPVFLAGPQGRGVILGEYLALEHVNPGNYLNSSLLVSETRLQRSILALALGEYKARHGRFPPSLSELVSEYLDEPPIDVFSGEEWIYQVSENGQSLLTYSIGKNCVDDDGSTKDKSAGTKGDDISIRVGILPGSREESAVEVKP